MSPEASVYLRDLLVNHEGLRLKPYLDSLGNLTIGVGRNLDEVGISEPEAFYLLERDIDRAMEDLKRNCLWFEKLDDVRQAVLIDMCFNIGWLGLSKFHKTLGLVEVGDFKQASEEMLDSTWADQVGRRAVALSKMMDSGKWPSIQ